MYPAFKNFIHNYRCFDASSLVNTHDKMNNEDFLSRLFFFYHIENFFRFSAGIHFTFIPDHQRIA
jgi:hypothetical protein